MKKSIFLFFAAILCSMSIDAYAATQRYIYVGLSNNYHTWKNASQWGINHWGGTGGGVVPGSKITDLKTTITHEGCTFHMYRMYVYDDNKNFEFKGSDNWWDCKKENISISGTTKNALLFRDNDGGDGGSPTFYQINYQEESIVSLSVSSNSVSVGEEVILTPTLTSNAEYNEITSTTYSVGTGATVSNGKFVATAAGTYTVTATITYNPKKFTGITKKVENITCEIVVSEVAIPHPVTSVTVAPTSVTIKQGATTTLTATVAPSNADDPSVTWSSDNQSVATVVNGVVTAVAVGTANITVTTVDGGFTATCAVKVKPLQYTFYAINSAEWPTVAAHYWEGADGGSAWPGANMVKESETINDFEIYSITISSDFVNIMFTNQKDGDQNKKTADLTTEGNDGKYYDIKDAKWYASLSEVPVPFDYYVIGTINGWAMGDANYGMKDDNKDGVYEKQITLAAGDHVIKVNDGTWDKQWQFSNLTATYVGVTEGTGDQGNKNGNIAIHLDAETTITIKLNPTKNELTLDGLTIDAPVVTYDYYVVGTINGWGLKDASYGMELSGDVYEKEVAFAIGKHELKINNGTWDNANTFGYDNLSVAYEGVSRGSGDGDNNIVIDLAEAKTIAIKFDNNTKKITLEGLTLKRYTVEATVNPVEAGTIEGAGNYNHGAEATLTATAAEGYEFVNWTVGGKEVSTEASYSFTVTADVALVANFKKKVSIITETYTLPADAADTNRGGQWYVEVPGEEEAKYQIIIPGYEGPGTYEEVTWRVNMNGDWTAMSATVTVTYDEENNLDVYVISATTEDGSTIYNVTLNVDHKEAEEEPEAAIIPLESYNPKVTKIIENWGDETEPWLVTSYVWTNGAYDPIEFNLTVTLAGLAPSLEGYINETFVIGVENEVLAGEEEGYAILRAQATDGTNTYTIELMAELTTEEEGGTRVINVVEAEIYPNSDYKTNLDIYGWSDTDEEVTVTLWEGTSKLYGEYTDDLNVYIGGWNEYYLAEETTATFALVDGLAVFNATVVNGNDTVVLTISGAPWVNPKDIVPTDTVNHTIVDGTIGTQFNMFLKISGSSDDISVNISTTNKTTTSEDIENCSSAYVEIDDVQINLLRGQFEIVTVGDVKIAYIGALGADHKWYNIILTTGKEAPTALDNLGTTVAPVKVIVNGQLIITKDGVQYNAQGQMVK